MFRFLGFGRKDSSCKPEELTEESEQYTEEGTLEFEYARTEGGEVNFHEEVYHEAKDYGHTETDTDSSSVVAQETEKFTFDPSGASMHSEPERPIISIEKEEILIEDKGAETVFRRKSMETVPSDYLITVMETMGHESVKTDLSEEAEQASNVFSQLSVDLFENTLREDPDFPRDLDRIYSWFTDVLTNAERIACAHVLLSTLTSNQLKFLFSALRVDPDARAEVSYLDLAKSQASERHTQESPIPSTTPSPSQTAMLEFSRFASLEFKPEDGLFGNISLASSSNSRSSSRFSSLIDRPKSTDAKTVDAKTIDAKTELFADYRPVFTSFTSAVADDKLFVTPSESSKPPGFEKVDHLDGLFNRFEKNEESQLTTSEQEEANKSTLKLSVDAPEFRPVPNYPEMAYANIFYTDFLSWMRTLRLHKYGPVLLPHYEKSKGDLLRSSEEDLERFGVSALGARRKFKRVFEQILTERPPLE